MRQAANYWIRFLLACFLAVFSVLFLSVGSAQAVPTIVPSPLPGAQVGIPYLTTLTAINFTPPPPYTWQVISGSLPPGLTLGATTGTISGTPTTAGTYTFFVTVTDSTGPSAPQGFFITVAPPPLTFVYPYLPQAMEGVSYQANIAVTGGTPPRTFSLVSGTLPSGLTLDPIGTIYGTPPQGTAGTYVITIGVTDSSTPPLSAQWSYTLVVRKGFYDSVITIASTLAAGETNVFVDGRKVATLRGGQTTRLSFAVGTEPTITVNPVVSHSTRVDVRFVTNVDKIVVDELFPDATFTYTPEYFVDLKTDPPEITSLTGSAWYKEGGWLKSTAPAQIEGKTGTQYRFSYWLLPAGEKLKGEDLSWMVNAPGKGIATYDTYYLLTVTSPKGKVDGDGWYKVGATAKWSINPPQVPMSGILGFFRGKLKPDSATGTEVMDAPKTVTVAWNPDYTMPAALISLLFLFLTGAGFGVYRFLYPPAPKPAVLPLPPPAPAPPTIVVIEGAPRPPLETTKERLVEQFRHLLQKYEDEVKTTVSTEGLPEAKVVPETQRLAPPKEEPALVCGYTSQNLLRTVVGNWWKKEERVTVPPLSAEKAAEKSISIVTVWARNIYSEWGVFTCSLPRAHAGNHQGATSKVYTLQNTVIEEKNYSAKQKITPPKPHFTDGLPLVDVAHHQIMDTHLAITPDRVIIPDKVIPPNETSSDS